MFFSVCPPSSSIWLILPSSSPTITQSFSGTPSPMEGSAKFLCFSTSTVSATLMVTDDDPTKAGNIYLAASFQPVNGAHSLLWIVVGHSLFCFFTLLNSHFKPLKMNLPLELCCTRPHNICMSWFFFLLSVMILLWPYVNWYFCFLKVVWYLKFHVAMNVIMCMWTFSKLNEICRIQICTSSLMILRDALSALVAEVYLVWEGQLFSVVIV